MYTKDQICEKIQSIHPDVGRCGIDLTVNYDTDNHAWKVGLKKGRQRLDTYLEEEDANFCMEGRQCIGLGLQISQLKDNISQLKAH